MFCCKPALFRAKRLPAPGGVKGETSKCLIDRCIMLVSIDLLDLGFRSKLSNKSINQQDQTEPMLSVDTSTTARSICRTRCWLPFRVPFPSSHTHVRWIFSIWPPYKHTYTHQASRQQTPKSSRMALRLALRATTRRPSLGVNPPAAAATSRRAFSDRSRFDDQVQGGLPK